MVTTETIRDARGNALGSVETTDDGSHVLRDAEFCSKQVDSGAGKEYGNVEISKEP